MAQEGPVVTLNDLLRRPAWQARAACRGMDTNMFFPNNGMKPVAARAVCDRCPVSKECLEFAVSDWTVEGVWAGTSPRQRQLLRRKAG